MKGKKILGIVSGGLDSVSFISGLARDNALALMVVDYGQKARLKEIETVQRFGDFLGVNVYRINARDICPDLPLFGKNQLTDKDTKVEDGYQPSVVVPLRNGLFVQIALVIAYSHGFDYLALGSHADDVTLTGLDEMMYPDCSPEFFRAIERAGMKGTFNNQKKVKILTPSILKQGKADLVKIGYKNLGIKIFDTWSCYKDGPLQCGRCESCRNRKAAFIKAGIEDQTQYEGG